MKERFPKEKEAIDTDAIIKQLKAFDAGSEDLALWSGDLIFAEAAFQMNFHVEFRVPFDIPEFLENSKSFAGGNCRDRFY